MNTLGWYFECGNTSSHDIREKNLIAEWGLFHVNMGNVYVTISKIISYHRKS